MDKIYSRLRIRIPKIKMFFSFNENNNKFNNLKLRKISKISTIIIIAIIVFYTIINAIYPIFEMQCSNKAKEISTILSNDIATEIMKKYEYKDLSTIEKDKDGNITLIKANIIPINEIISEIPVRLQQSLKENKISEFYIRLGSFTGIKLISGLGPNIKIKISSIGDIETTLKSQFLSAGINQTIHRIYLEIKCNVTILTPINTITEGIVNQVLLAEAVIVGTVPNSYYNLEGMNKDNAIDIIQ